MSFKGCRLKRKLPQQGVVALDLICSLSVLLNVSEMCYKVWQGIHVYATREMRNKVLPVLHQVPRDEDLTGLLREWRYVCARILNERVEVYLRAHA
jgi:hypothetical protein